MFFHEGPGGEWFMLFPELVDLEHGLGTLVALPDGICQSKGGGGIVRHQLLGACVFQPVLPRGFRLA